MQALRLHILLLVGCSLAATEAAAKSRTATHAAAAAPAKLPPAPPPAEISPGTLQIESEPSVLRITAPDTSASGTLVLSQSNNAPWAAALRLTPEAQNGHLPRILFMEPTPLERRALDLARVCPSGPVCTLHYRIEDIRAVGILRLTATVLGRKGETIATEEVSVDRDARPAAPTLSGDAVAQQKITLDTYDSNSFWLKLQNADAGRTLQPSIVAALPQDPACPPPVLSLTPVQAHLDPGKETLLHVTVKPCAIGDQDGLLTIGTGADGSEPLTGYQLSVKRYNWSARLLRDAFDGGRLPLVLLGAFISLALNNFFPFQRSRKRLSESLSRISSRIAGFSNLGTGLVDALEAEASAIRKALFRPHFWDSSKTDQLHDVQLAMDDFDARVAIAVRIDAAQTQMLAKLDQLSVDTSWALQGKLLDAEDALLAADKDAANSLLADTKTLFDGVFTDTGQTALRNDVVKRLASLGSLDPQLDPDEPLIRTVLSRLRSRLAAPPADKRGIGYTVPADADLQDLLSIEQDIATCGIWVHDVHPRLAQDKERFTPFWGHLSEALERTPKSQRTRMMVDMFRACITPADLVHTLASKGADIVGDPKPQEFEISTYRVRLKDEVLSQLPLAHQFINCLWHFDDNTITPSHMYRCRHFFVRPKKRYPWEARRPFHAHAVITVPFADYRATAKISVTPQARSSSYGYALMEGVSFVIFTLIAVISAYKTQYATAATGLSMADGVNAFLFGFGLDQLRDTVTNQSTTRLAAPKPALAAS